MVNLCVVFFLTSLFLSFFFLVVLKINTNFQNKIKECKIVIERLETKKPLVVSKIADSSDEKTDYYSDIETIGVSCWKKA